jgi:hypothetical protein
VRHEIHSLALREPSNDGAGLRLDDIREWRNIRPHAFSLSWDADCSWMPHRRYMICDFQSDGVDPQAGGIENNLSLFTYSPSEHAFHHMGITRDAKPLFEKMELAGDTWTDQFEIPYKGSLLYCKDVYTFTSPSRYIRKFEISADQGATWTLVSTGVGTRSS